MLIYARSPISDFCLSVSVEGQEGSGISAFVCLISSALLLSICSLWGGINQQLWTRYHVTTRNYSDVKSARRALIRTQIAPELEHPSQTVRLSPPRRRSSPPLLGRQGQLVGGSLGRQQRRQEHSQMWYQRHKGPGGRGGGSSEAVRYTVALLLCCTYSNPWKLSLRDDHV